MDIDKLSPVLITANTTQASSIGSSDDAKKKFAMDFETIFISRLLEEMKNTIGDWGEEKDGASQQIDGLFNMFLANGLGEQGGFGLWKDIYNSLVEMEEKGRTTELVDKKI